MVEKRLWKIVYTSCGIFVTFIPLLSLILSVTLLTWALVHHGEGKATISQCSHRTNNDGFHGNPDFYGLGIRLGVYLQWISSLIASATLPRKERSMAGAYVSFITALYVALLLLVFQGDCAFTAEVIVVLYFAWGGVYVVLEPFHCTAFRPLRHGSHVEGYLEMMLFRHMAFVMMTLLLPTTAWFWIRLATVGEVDFLPTPKGTVFFLFTSVHSAHFKLGSKFMLFLCFLGYVVKLFQTPTVGFFQYSYRKWVDWYGPISLLTSRKF